MIERLKKFLMRLRSVPGIMDGYGFYSWGEHFRDLTKELEDILAANPEPVVRLRPGWVCKDRNGLWWFANKPEFGTDRQYDRARHDVWCRTFEFASDANVIDPWPDKPNGGPECLMEVR